MLTYGLISAWTSICQQFFPVFTQPTAQVFLRLLTGWVLCTGRRTITGIIPFADPGSIRSHDAYHRFFSKASWDPQRLWELLARMLVRLFYPTGVIPVDLDDTVFHHTGRKMDGAGIWRDAVRSTKNKLVYCWGLNLVVLTVRVVAPWGGEPVLLVISRDPDGKERDDFFFTTDLSMAPAEVIGTFAGRWSIEDTFKNTKQFLGAEPPQSWKDQGPERAAVLGLTLYSLVWTWYLRHGYRKTSVVPTPWYPGKTTPSFQDALAALRRVLWRDRIISMFGKQAVHYKISKFLIAALEKAA